jgi:hypothetical protein
MGTAYERFQMSLGMDTAQVLVLTPKIPSIF